MTNASKKSPEEKLRVVLSVLRGELSVAAAGGLAGVSEQTVHNWKKAFLEGGRDRLAPEHGRRQDAPGRQRHRSMKPYPPRRVVSQEPPPGHRDNVREYLPPSRTSR